MTAVRMERDVHLVGAPGVGKSRFASVICGRAYDPTGSVPHSIIQSVVSLKISPCRPF